MSEDLNIEEKLENAGLTMGEVIGKAKRKYRSSKEVKSYLDMIEKDEQKLFAQDEYLADLILEQIMIDQEITDYMDRVLALHRKNQSKGVVV